MCVHGLLQALDAMSVMVSAWILQGGFFPSQAGSRSERIFASFLINLVLLLVSHMRSLARCRSVCFLRGPSSSSLCYLPAHGCRHILQSRHLAGGGVCMRCLPPPPPKGLVTIICRR